MNNEEGRTEDVKDEGNGKDCDCGCECADSGCMVEGEEGLPVIAWPDPKPEELDMPEFNAVWKAIKSWDINVPEVYMGYCGATGNHVKAILDALRAIDPNFCPVKQLKDS
jgi:hypothetical protein